MNAFSKVLAASAIALSLGAAAAPANAGVYLDFAESNSGATFQWLRDADTVGGNLSATGQVTLNIFNNALTDGAASILANFTLTGRDEATASLNTQAQYQQWEVAGNFAFTAVNAFVYDGINYAAGTNLLSAVFTSADFIGAGNRGNFSAQNLVGGATVNYSSAILSSSAQFTLDTFNFEMTQVQPNFGATNCTTVVPGAGILNCDTSINSLGGNTRGTFSAAVPEPTTWALMIMGFGGAGAMIRRRKALAVA